MNLVLNARDAISGGRGAMIAIRTAVVTTNDGPNAKRWAQLEVVDDGCGMPEHVVAQACEPFFTTKLRGKGTGLGLSQVARWIDQVGGILSIDSAEGLGTTIRLRIPRPD